MKAHQASTAEGLPGRAEVPIEAGDTPASLEQRVLAAEHALYPQVLSEFVQR